MTPSGPPTKKIEVIRLMMPSTMAATAVPFLLFPLFPLFLATGGRRPGPGPRPFDPASVGAAV
ncbi:hypothetical protein GCM10010433_29460 [Streptomyces pulveraceus]